MRLIVVALALGCSLDLGFDVPFDVPSITVAGDGAAHMMRIHVDASAAPFALDITLGDQTRGKVPGGVSTVTLASLDLAVMGDGCFDFVDDVTLTIASTKPDTTLEPVVIATGTEPGCVRTFALTPSTVNLKAYLDEGASLRAAGSGIPPATSVTFNGHAILHASL